MGNLGMNKSCQGKLISTLTVTDPVDGKNPLVMVHYDLCIIISAFSRGTAIDKLVKNSVSGIIIRQTLS